MEQEIKNTSAGSVQACQNCKQDFTIEPEDFLFYEKIKADKHDMYIEFLFDMKN